MAEETQELQPESEEDLKRETEELHRAIVQYLEWAGLKDTAGVVPFDRLEVYAAILRGILEKSRKSVDQGASRTTAVLPEERQSYRVPLLSSNGACSIVGELAPKPFNVLSAIGGRSIKNATFVRGLTEVVDALKNRVKCEWMGIYLRRTDANGKNPRLIKLAYYGIESRAEFPLTKEFSAKSNNSKVGLTGEAVVIDNVNAHVQGGGTNYTCDRRVQSEACLPIFDKHGAVVGIVDAEAHQPRFFLADRLSWLVALCIAVSEEIELWQQRKQIAV